LTSIDCGTQFNVLTGSRRDQGTWGRRIGGGDALSLSADIGFADIGALCQRIERAHARVDYRDSFDWIDYIRPINDLRLIVELEGRVIEALEGDDSTLSLAPPEVVDWERASGFRFHFERPQGTARSTVSHPDLRLGDYLRGLARTNQLESLSTSYLRQHSIQLVDDSGNVLQRWPVWRCLVGEFELRGSTFVLDEGDFFDVRHDYLETLDAFIDGIPSSDANLPATTPATEEGVYNIEAADSNNLLLLDRQLIRVQGRTTPIEICDLLSRTGQLIHVKRHLGSSNHEPSLLAGVGLGRVIAVKSGIPTRSPY
jgi:uncharacterized protein (TIGR04141 family)